MSSRGLTEPEPEGPAPLPPRSAESLEFPMGHETEERAPLHGESSLEGAGLLAKRSAKGLVLAGLFAMLVAIGVVVGIVYALRPADVAGPVIQPSTGASEDHNEIEPPQGPETTQAGTEIEVTGTAATEAPQPSTIVEAQRVEEMLLPLSVTASNTRAPVPSLRCGGSNSFGADFLIDGDLQTGWGAASGDGAGQSVTLDFGREVELTRVGLTPGYLRVAPRSSEGCAEVLAFDYNRFVEVAQYLFDDGTSVTHVFEFVPEMQFLDVSTRTRFVTIVIVTTSLTSGDEDTILSEAGFFGFDP